MTSWSHSQHALLHECRRRWYFRYRMANGWGDDGVRREAWVLKQVQSLAMWWGALIHTGIERHVVPAWRRGDQPDFDAAAESTIELARRQFRYSRDKRYRERYASPKHDNFAALDIHESAADDAPATATPERIRSAFDALPAVAAAAGVGAGTRIIEAEELVSIEAYGAQIWAKMDLVLEDDEDRQIVIDWKTGISALDRRQFHAYAWICSERSGGEIGLERIVTRAANLASGEVQEVVACDADIDRLADRIFEDVRDMNALPRPESADEGRGMLSSLPLARSVRTCAYCNFRNLCQELS